MYGGKTGFIFTSEVGTVIDPRNFDRWWSRQCTKAHMPKGYTFHRLRHGYASILAKQNVASRVAQDTMRHAQYSTTGTSTSTLPPKTVCGCPGRSGLDREGAYRMSSRATNRGKTGHTSTHFRGKKWFARNLFPWENRNLNLDVREI
jgi:Phage integrase family